MVRVLRLLKMSRGSVMLFTETMQKSFRPLNMLFMILAVVIIVASALMYFIERGRYNFKMQYWERPVAYRCAVYLTSTAAMGASPTYQAGEGNDCSLISVAADQLSAGFLCTYPYRKNPNCVTVYEQSPFNSILHSFWWSWVSMCTVGYGDVNPATILGKTFGMIVVVVRVPDLRQFPATARKSLHVGIGVGRVDCRRLPGDRIVNQIPVIVLPH